MTVKFTNNASTTVGTGINASATSLTVASASSFPQLSGADDYCYLTLQGATNTTREVVKATALSGNTFTIVRAQDNTSAASWVAGDIVELRMTAALLTDVIDAATVEGVKTNYQYTPTAGQTVFSGADNASATMIINQAALVSVYMNGVRLVQGTDYSVSSANNTVTLGIGATTADIIDIEVYGNFVGQSGAAVGITGGSITGTAITATSLGATGTATLNTLVSNNATISGGSLNGVTIGGTTRGAISGNAISGTSFASTGDITISNGNNRFVASSTSSGDYVRMYGGGGTGKWDIYGHGANLRIGDNESAGLVQIDTDLYTVGSVTAGGLTVDTDTLVVDATNNRVGIGVTPTEKLDISQSVNNSVIAKVTNTNSGDLANARTEIHNDNSSFGQLTTYSSGFAYSVLGSNAANWTFLGTSGSNSNGLKIGTLTADPVVFGTSDLERLRLDASGNLGLGVVPPSSQVSYIRNVQIEGLQAYGHTGVDDWGGFFTNSYIDAAGVRKYISSSQYAHNLHFDNNGSFIFYNAPNTNSAGDTVPFVERLRIDAAGNAGLGVVPSAWGSYYSTINAGSAGNLSFFTGQTNAPVANVGVNLYNDNTNFRYAATGAASFYQQYVGQHRWYNVASGGVGNIATPVQAMTLDASGNLFVGGITQAEATSVTLNSQGYIYAKSSHQQAAFFDRDNSDGEIVTFRRQGTAVGGIGNNANNLTVDGLNAVELRQGGATRAYVYSSGLHPWDNATYSLGNADGKWSDLYLSGGTHSAGSSTFTGATPMSFNKAGSDTYTKTVLYDSQNNTANSIFSGLTLEMGRLTNSGTATPRTFTITDRGATNRWCFSQYGLSFNPTNGVASAAESLDSYEEGTWTPTLEGHYGTHGTTFNQGSRSGWYTKVGRLVTCQLQISSAGVAAANNSDIICISGFPFANTGIVATGASAHTSVAASQGGCWTFITGNTVAFLGNNGTATSTWAWQTGTSWETAHCAVRLTITYTTT